MGRAREQWWSFKRNKNKKDINETFEISGTHTEKGGHGKFNTHKRIKGNSE